MKMKIVVITFHSGTMIAKFKQDPELLELIINDFDAIDDIIEVDFEGRISSPERAIRDLIRTKGKAEARKDFERALKGEE